MLLLCCFTGGTAEPQYLQSQQQDAHLDITPETTSITAGRDTPVAPLPSLIPSLSVVANDCMEEDRRSSPATSRNLLKLPVGAPRFSELYARLSHIRGSWHARGVAAMHVLSQQLGLQIATLWALSSDGTYFVVQASGGPRRHALRPGASTPAALGDRQANSLQRVQASKMTTVYSCIEGGPNEGTPAAGAAAGAAAGLVDPLNCHQYLGNPQGSGRPAASIAASSQHSSRVAPAGMPLGPGGGAVTACSLGGGGSETTNPASLAMSRLPHDLAELAAVTGGALTDFAVLPLMSGGEVVGAVTLGLHRAQIPPQRRAGSRKVSDDASRRNSAANSTVPVAATVTDSGIASTGGGGGGGGGVVAAAVAATFTGVQRSPSSLTDRIRRALTRDKDKDREDEDGSRPASRAGSATSGGQKQSSCRMVVSTTAPAAASSPPALPSTCWLHSAACVYQLSQLAHFLGYGFFSDTEQSSFVAQSCSLVSGVSAAPDVQNLVNCLIGTTKSLIYQRFRLQAQCLVALVHSSGTTAAFFKQQRTPRGSAARAGGVAGAAASTMAVQGRAQSQRDMASQQRPLTINAAAAAAAAPGMGIGVSNPAVVASAGHCGPGTGGALPAAAALLQANLSNTSGGAGGGGAGGGGGVGGVSSSLHGLSAVLLGRKTRSQSQMRTTRSVPLQDPDNLMGYVSETMSTSVTATVISLSHTLLHDALHSQPPAGTAVRSCADTLARDGAPIRDISLACRLCDSRFGAGLGGALGEDSVNNSGAFAGHSASHAPPLSASPSMLRKSTCGRYAPLGSLVIALGLGFGAAAVGGSTGSTRVSGVGARSSPDVGQTRGLMEAHPVSMGEDFSCQNTMGGQVAGTIGTGVGGSGLGVGVNAGVGGGVMMVSTGNEPILALYVGFREVLQESALERVLEEMTQVAELVAPSVQQRLLGSLLSEWAQMSSRLMHPSSFIGGQSVLSQGAGGGGSRRGRRRSSHEWTEALGTVELWPPSASNLSFALEDPAPLSHLQVLVNSLHSTLSSIQVERALEEGTDSPLLANDMRGLELLQQIGRGGQGVVYRGRMHGIHVAVKVIPTAEGGGGMGPVDRDVAFEPDNAEAARRAARRQRALLRDALEVAASAAVAHPHLVQLHTYFTDVMVVEYEGDEGRFRLMHVADTAPGDPTGAINLVLVLEYCDGGNLRQAMERGVFFRRDARLAASPASLPAARAEAAGAGGAAAALAAAAELHPNFEFIYLTLLEVALAIRHMHAMRLAHCDVGHERWEIGGSETVLGTKGREGVCGALKDDCLGALVTYFMVWCQ
ncbi:hypothetical protein Vafri_6679 [Volvox africanus]|uniref:Protein kinase domain-containing protein n=1 Tax=Volvox africanus TaxID=51714 RepID=A0A8J4B388_9CHLO|nr:hypothetical protein Vafri_6679 [Volvox africanus]